MRKNLTRGLCFILIALCLTLPVSANSAQWYWNGVDASGAIITDGESPIVVENELLTFDLQEFPVQYASEEKFLAYSGKVTAEYSFYNPSDMTVNATLVFPFGAYPDYTYSDKDVDVDKYGVSVDGEEIEVTVRHSLAVNSYNGEFSFNSQIPPLSDEYISFGKYTPDSAVTVYRWSLKGNEFSYNSSVCFAADINHLDESRDYYLVGANMGHLQKNGKFRIGDWARQNGYIELYVFGEPLTELPRWKFYQDGGAEDGEEVEGIITYTGRETIPLIDFAMQNYTDEIGVSEIDWYNAVISEIYNDAHGGKYNILSLDAYERNYSRDFARCYQYSITLEPGERIVNSVTAPIYPSINTRYTSPIYEYTYLLSPAGSFADFGSLEIRINTPFYLVNSEVEGFTKTEEGYSLVTDGLPRDDDGRLKELVFTLSTEENPVNKNKTPEGIFKNLFLIVIFFWQYILIGIGVLIILIFIIKRLFRR